MPPEHGVGAIGVTTVSNTADWSSFDGYTSATIGDISHLATWIKLVWMPARAPTRSLLTGRDLDRRRQSALSQPDRSVLHLFQLGGNDGQPSGRTWSRTSKGYPWRYELSIRARPSYSTRRGILEETARCHRGRDDRDVTRSTPRSCLRAGSRLDRRDDQLRGTSRLSVAVTAAPSTGPRRPVAA